jgi:hypothetical protein
MRIIYGIFACPRIGYGFMLNIEVDKTLWMIGLSLGG